MTREEQIDWLCRLRADLNNGVLFTPWNKEFTEALNKALEQEPRKGEWLRMSDLSEQEDDRYKCSRCGNVIHHKNKMDLYTFNSWCGRCGSDNDLAYEHLCEEIDNLLKENKNADSN